MKDDIKLGLKLLFIVTVIASMSVFFVTSCVMSNMWKKDIIEHGAARYNPETGRFEWLMN